MHDTDSAASETDEAPSQAKLYDDLRRIGELEDEKAKIQTEIDAKVDVLRAALGKIDKSSLLHQVLTAALAPTKPAAPAKKKPARGKTARKKKAIIR